MQEDGCLGPEGLDLAGAPQHPLHTVTSVGFAGITAQPRGFIGNVSEHIWGVPLVSGVILSRKAERFHTHFGRLT